MHVKLIRNKNQEIILGGEDFLQMTIQLCATHWEPPTLPLTVWFSGRFDLKWRIHFA